MQPVDRAQVLAAPIGEGFGLLLRPGETKPAGGGQTVAKKYSVPGAWCGLGFLRPPVKRGLAVGEVRRQSRIKPAEGAGKVATFGPGARAHTRNRKVRHCDVASLD